MTAAEIDAFLAREFPEVVRPRVLRVSDTVAELALDPHSSQLRPGGTISGPTLMALADTAMYALVLAAHGEVALAVTTHLSMSFLSRPAPGGLVARATFLKAQGALLVGEVGLRSSGAEALCAHAVVTYAMPRRAPLG